MTWTLHPLPNEHITLTLHQPLLGGEQVFNSYGPKSNEELLASYGFVNDGLQDDTVTLKLGGHHGSQGQQHYWHYSEPCPPALLQEVRAALRQAHDVQSNGDVDLSPIKLLEEEGEAVDTIIGLLEQKIAAFNATQSEVDLVLKGDATAVRESVRYNVNIYRKSGWSGLSSVSG